MMNSEQYNLSNLRDIVIPEPPPIWPPAPGVWLVLGGVAAIVLIIVWRFYATRRKNAYRRAGLVLLAQARSAYDISVILKRVALAVFPREQVASLHGESWINFLNRTCPRCQFPQECTIDPDSEASQELVSFARLWILKHSVSSDPCRQE